MAIFVLSSCVIDFQHGRWTVTWTGCININYDITDIYDPHTPISQDVITASQRVAKAVTAIEVVVKKVALPTVLVLNIVRLGSAIYQDINRDDGKPKEIIKASASITGCWSGSALGGLGGHKVSIWIGGVIGALFGDIGRLPGAAIRAIIGGIIGSVGGGFVTSYELEKLVDQVFIFDEEKSMKNELFIVYWNLIYFWF